MRRGTAFIENALIIYRNPVASIQPLSDIARPPLTVGAANEGEHLVHFGSR